MPAWLFTVKVDSSLKRTFLHFSIGHLTWERAQSNRRFLCFSVKSGFFRALHPRRPFFSNLLLTVGADNSTPLLSFNSLANSFEFSLLFPKEILTKVLSDLFVDFRFFPDRGWHFASPVSIHLFNTPCTPLRDVPVFFAINLCDFPSL